MKKLFILKISLLTSTPIFAEAITESLQTLTPTQEHLYNLATTSKKRPSVSESPAQPVSELPKKPVRNSADKVPINSRFLPQNLKDLNQTQLEDFFRKITVPKNQELLAEDSSLDKYTKVSQSISNKPPKSPEKFSRTQVSVINTDTVSATLSLMGMCSTNPVVLNLANKTVPGGGVQKGSKAQEEDLCRTTTLYTSLSNAKTKRAYPLGEFEALYSPKVLAHQQPKAGSFAVITMAGYRATGGQIDPADYPGETKFLDGMLEKARVIIDTAIANGHQDIILGALGCGAFAKDSTGAVIPHISKDVAKAFAMVLQEAHPISRTPRYQHFRNIQFAILENPKSTPLGNTFKAALGILPTGDSTTIWSPSTPFVPIPQSTIDISVLPGALEARDAPKFDTRIVSIEIALLSANRKLSSFFSDPNVKVKLIGQKAWTAYKAPWPVKVNSYSEKDGCWIINASFANGNDHVAEVEITGHWKSLDPDARAWLKKVTKP